MLLVFQGRGRLVPVTGFAAIAVADLAGLHDPCVVRDRFALSGPVDRYLGNRWNSAEGRPLEDLLTGKVVEHRSVHSFFWVSMQHWLWVEAGMVMLFNVVFLRHVE